jgi:WD40 repeat protein
MNRLKNICIVIFLGIAMQFGYGQITDNWCLIFQTQQSSEANAADFSPDRKYLATAHKNGIVSIWNTNTWTIVSNISSTPTAEPLTVRFSKDGSKLAIGYFNARLSIINSTNWVVIYTSITAHVRIR